jgi:hypothetical protein
MKGQKQYEAFKAGKPLSFKGAILAQCYSCNGESEGGEDCLGISCPLYQYMPYRKGRVKKELSAERKAMAVENLRKARESAILSSKTPGF